MKALLSSLLRALAFSSVLSLASAQTIYQNVQRDSAAANTDNAIARWDGTTNKVQNSVLIVADTTGALSGFTTGAGLTFHGGGTLTGASGALTLTASGTNQNITLTPSGTGSVINQFATSRIIASEQYASQGTLHAVGVAVAPSSSNWAVSGDGATNQFNANTTLQLSIGGAAKVSLTSSSLTGSSSVVFQPTYNALGSSPQNVLNLVNGTGALAGVQQYSPSFEQQGAGWKTDATAASRTVGFRRTVRPVQGAANPTGILAWEANINSSYTDAMTLTSAGALSTVGGITSGSFIALASGSPFLWGGGTSTRLNAPADGVLRVSDAADTGGGRIIIGTNDTSGVAWAKSSTTLKARLGDDSADAAITAAAGTFSGQLIGKGTATNDAAAAGVIGELLSAQRLVASTLSLTTATAADITSVSLTAGDWEVSGVVAFVPANTTTVTNLVASISATTATQASVDSVGGYEGSGVIYTSTGNANYQPITPTRISLASTTTYYLVATATFGVSTTTGYGTIRARRLR